MQKSVLVSIIAFGAALSLSGFAWSGDRDGSRRGDTSSATGSSVDMSKSENGTQSADLTINVAFSGQSGRTVTDSHGTCYNIWGFSSFERKVYSPAYWGVFPLYFFGDRVGATVVVTNQSLTRKVKLLLSSDSYCLNIDGSSGTQLMTPAAFETSLAPGETKTVDASFTVDYVAGADSGLDRFLIEAYQAPDDGNGEHTVSGEININPNNSTDNEFTLALPGGVAITRDALTSYAGPATSVTVKPKGYGNQNSLVVDGQPYTLENANSYFISGNPMTVNLYNDNGGGVMGQWWMALDVTNATITSTIDGQGDSRTQDAQLIMTKEAIFCPPEFEGALWQAVVDTLVP